jgi:two-component system sensor histidine kinase/response regulator
MNAIDKGIELRGSIDVNVPPTIISDVNRFKQILLNILSNAMKFTFEGYIEVSAELCKYVTVESPRNATYLKVSVTDTGVGMHEHEIANLFNLYGKLEGTAHLNK